MPVIAGPYRLPVRPAVVQVGGSKGRPLEFADYQHKLHAFKVGRAEFDAPLRVRLDPSSHTWSWQYLQGDKLHSGHFANPGFSLDYRSERNRPGENLVSTLSDYLQQHADFLPLSWLHNRLLSWSRLQRVQLYVGADDAERPLDLTALLKVTREVLYDQALETRSWPVLERLLDEVQRDLLEKVFHKIRYDIDKRHYRYDTVRQSSASERGDFIEHYSLSYELESEQQKQALEQDAKLLEQLQLQLEEERGQYHIYQPLLNEAAETLLQQHKLRRINISPDSLNAGERKFLRDLLAFIDTNYSRDHREFYLMRNVDSLRSIGVYLEGETRVFYPDFVLWIVDDKSNRTTLALFDPKGQTGIVKEDDLGLRSADGMNDKVRLATSGQLASLAQQLATKTGRRWSVHSFILLRDSSPLGRWRGSAPTSDEVALAETMIQRGVLRLDWHTHDESGKKSVCLPDGSSYLSRIFDILNR